MQRRSGESEKVVSIQLVKDSVAAVEGKAQDIGVDKKDQTSVAPADDEDDEEEDFGPRFKVILEKPDPE